MMKFLRSQSQTVLVVVLGVIGLGFLFYGSQGTLLTSGVNRGSSDYGRIDGEDVTMAELTDAVRNTRYSLIINGHGEELRQPGAAAQVADLAWQQLLLLREADRLHITVGTQEVVDYIRSRPLFQKDGVYSPDVYQSRMAELKAILRIPSDSEADPLATTKATFESVLRNDLRREAVTNALFSGVRSSAHDVSAEYQKLYGPATVSLVTFDPKSFIASAQVSPAEIEAEYKANPTNPAYRTQEKRKVDYVLLPLTPDQVKLPDAQKTAAMQALGQKALDFALALQPEPSADGAPAAPPDFLAEAKKRGLNLATTDFFAVDTQPAGLPPSTTFNNTAFTLTKDNPTSGVIDVANGVAVLHLAEIEPSDLRPLDQVKGDILKHLQQAKGMETARITAKIMALALKNTTAKEGSFNTAATGMKLKLETLQTFVPIQVIRSQQSDPRFQTIAYAVTTLAPGQVSEPVPIQSDNTAVVLHLDQRGPADPAGMADFETRFPQIGGRSVAADCLQRLGGLEEQAARHKEAAAARGLRVGGLIVAAVDVRRRRVAGAGPRAGSAAGTAVTKSTSSALCSPPCEKNSATVGNDQRLNPPSGGK